MKPLIRLAGRADSASLLPLVEDFVASFEVDAEQFSASFLRLLDNRQAHLLVAESDDTLVGYCLGFVHDTFYANGPVAWVEEIMVHADYRRSGLGAGLMTAFESWAKSQGAALSALATRRAASFYSSIGYKESATYFRRLL